MRTQFRVSRLLLSRSFLCLFVCCLLLRGGTERAQASDIRIVFMPDTNTVMQGDTNPINYTALFSNNTATDLLITDVSANSMDPNVGFSYGFFNGINGNPFELTAGQQNLLVPNVISLNLDSTVPVGTYTFDATFTGRNFSGGSERDLGTGTLHVNVQAAGSPTPEFGSVWTLGGLLLAGGIGAWRQHRRRPTISREAPHAA